MKSFSQLLIINTALLFLAPAISNACVRIPDSDMAIAGSYKSEQQVYHGKVSEYVFGSCKKFIGQYIVLVSSPSYTDPLYKTISSPEGELPEERCSIANSPFSVSNPADVGIENFYHSQTAFMNTCLEAEVTDARGEIDALTQVNCEIAQVSLNKVIARGPRCAFKIYENSAFSIHYRMNPECLKLSYLKEKGSIRPMDSKASLGIYKTSNLAPGSPEYEILGLINGRITLQPDNDLIPVAKYAGTVGSEWPVQYGTQIEFGKVALTRTTRLHNTPYVYLRTPFEVNNNCPEVCKDGFCTSPCDFYAPVAARMTLKKKEVGATSFHSVDFWYQGNLVPSRFLGELAFGKAIDDQNINVGDMYLLVAEFSNPTLTYRTILDEAKQLLIKLSKISISTKGAGRRGGLDGLGVLQGTNIVPENPGLIGLGGIREDETTVDSYLNVLGSMVGTDDSWPPYYNRIISGDQVDNPNRIFLTLKVGFRIASMSPTGAVSLDKVQYMKESKIFGNYNKPVVDAPEIKCAM